MQKRLGVNSDLNVSQRKDCDVVLHVTFIFSSDNFNNIYTYRKIPNVSPGLIEVFKHFLGGLYSGGLTFGGAYIRRAFCVSVRVSRP